MVSEQFSVAQISQARRDWAKAKVERMAQSMWQEESLRCLGQTRSIPWADESEDTQEKWRRLAVAGLEAALLFDREGKKS